MIYTIETFGELELLGERIKESLVDIPINLEFIIKANDKLKEELLDYLQKSFSYKVVGNTKITKVKTKSGVIFNIK